MARPGIIAPMFRTLWLRRHAITLMVCALLLKAAVPMLASAAGGLQGKSVAEICTVYGVALAAADEHRHHAHHAQSSGGEDHSKHAATAHNGEHCALTALVAFAAADAPRVGLPDAQTSHQTSAARARPAAPDACAQWVARLRHGPPSTS
jgi:hypothetical protein